MFLLFVCLFVVVKNKKKNKASIEQQLEKAKQELVVAQTGCNFKDMESAVEELQASKTASEKLLSSLSEQIVGASQVDAANERLKAVSQSVAAKESELKVLVDRHGAALLKVLECSVLPSHSLLGGALQKAADKARAHCASLAKQVDELRAARASLVAREEAARTELGQLKKSIATAKAQLARVPGLAPNENAAAKLLLVESTLEDDAARVAELAAQQALYGAFIARADSVCLVCDRPFDHPDEANRFAERLREKLRSAETELGPAKKEKEECEQVVSILRPAVTIQVWGCYFVVVFFSI